MHAWNNLHAAGEPSHGQSDVRISKQGGRLDALERAWQLHDHFFGVYPRQVEGHAAQLLHGVPPGLEVHLLRPLIQYLRPG